MLLFVLFYVDYVPICFLCSKVAGFDTWWVWGAAAQHHYIPMAHIRFWHNWVKLWVCHWTCWRHKTSNRSFVDFARTNKDSPACLPCKQSAATCFVGDCAAWVEAIQSIWLFFGVNVKWDGLVFDPWRSINCKLHILKLSIRYSEAIDEIGTWSIISQFYVPPQSNLVGFRQHVQFNHGQLCSVVNLELLLLSHPVVIVPSCVLRIWFQSLTS